MHARTERGAATRRLLLEAAARELAARDGDLEVQAVADRAGVSPGLIYRYFESKAGLVAAVVEDFYDRYDREVIRGVPRPGAGWAARERARTERGVAFLYGEPLAPAVLSRLSREPGVAAIEARRVGRTIRTAARNLALGQRRGEIPADLDPVVAGAMLVGGVRQAVVEALSREESPSREALVDALWGCIVAAVRFRPATQAAGPAAP